MKIQPFQRPRRGDYPQISDQQWNLYEMIFLSLESLTQAQQGRLTDAENLNAEVRELDLTSGQAQVIQLNVLRGKPQSVAVIWSEDSSQPMPQLAWRILDENKIEVTPTFSITPTKAAVRLMIKGD